MNSNPENEPNTPTTGENRAGKLFLYVFGIPLILTIVIVSIANALGW